MTKKAADQTAPEESAGKPANPLGLSAVILVLLDTSARLFIPSVGGTVLGLWLDITHNTKPWFTIVGVISGTILALWMVYLQLKAIDKQKESK